MIIYFLKSFKNGHYIILDHDFFNIYQTES